MGYSWVKNGGIKWDLMVTLKGVSNRAIGNPQIKLICLVNSLFITWSVDDYSDSMAMKINDLQWFQYILQ